MLDHYFCHCFLPHVRLSPPPPFTFTCFSLALREKNIIKRYEGLPRHHSDDAQHWRDRHARRRIPTTFSFIATITPVLVRFKILFVNQREQVKVEVELVDIAALPSSTCTTPCGCPSCINAFPNDPLVVRRSSI